MVRSRAAFVFMSWTGRKRGGTRPVLGDYVWGHICEAASQVTWAGALHIWRSDRRGSFLCISDFLLSLFRAQIDDGRDRHHEERQSDRMMNDLREIIIGDETGL